MFDEGVFRYHLKIVEESRRAEFVIQSLHLLRDMTIPISYTEEIVKKVEQFLRKDGSWRPAMKLIRKLEHRKKYPCMNNYARKLPDSLLMEQWWRKARLQQIRDRKRIEALGASCSSGESSEDEEEEDPLPDVLEDGEIPENVVFAEQTEEIPESVTPDFQNIAEFKKKKKKKKGNKHKKRTRKRHYAKSNPE